MTRKMTTWVALGAVLLLVVAMPLLASESGAYRTSDGNVVQWTFSGPTPDNPNGSWSWTKSCPHCGTVLAKGNNEPPEWGQH
jgi:hypothetical protein